MTYWLHRISHEAKHSMPLLERGKLTIGFSDLSTQDFLDKATEPARSVDDDDLKMDVRKAYGQLLRSRHSLWRFLREMQVGDLVIVPQVPQQGQYSVYAIKGEPKLLEGFGDLGFYRDVEVHEIGNKKAQGISRAKYADRALTACMKIRITNVGISDLGENIERALKAYRDGKPIALRSRTPELAEQLLCLIYNELSPGKFESLLKWYFRRIGASDVCTPQKNRDDGDVDIRASFDRARLLSVFKRSSMIQKHPRMAGLFSKSETMCSRIERKSWTSIVSRMCIRRACGLSQRASASRTSA